MLIVDAHQDLAWNALTFGRDYTRSARETRERERGTAIPEENGDATLGLPEYLAGGIGLIFGTLFAAPARHKLGPSDTQCYADAEEAHQVYRRQLDYYHDLVAREPRFRLVRSKSDLDAVVAPSPRHPVPPTRSQAHTLTPSHGGEGKVVGLVVLMEGADGIREPEEVAWWWERGVRLVGLSWAGTRCAGGTGEPGPLTAAGRELLDVMARVGAILDLSHASDESYSEALARYPGTVVATHANPRALVPGTKRPERFLSDEMIRELVTRDGVIGIVPYNAFLEAAWTKAAGKEAVPLDRVIDAIDYVCQLAGDARHVGIGSDFDGGFGLQSTPAEIDTVADLTKIADRLRGRGYAAADVAAVMGGNWLGALGRGLSS